MTNNLSKSTNSPRQLNSCSNTLHFNMKCFLGTHAKFPESAPPARLVYVLVKSRRHKIFATFKLISKNLDDSLAGFFCFSSNHRQYGANVYASCWLIALETHVTRSIWSASYFDEIERLWNLFWWIMGSDVDNKDCVLLCLHSPPLCYLMPKIGKGERAVWTWTLCWLMLFLFTCGCLGQHTNRGQIIDKYLAKAQRWGRR